ncbi:hypothetical protein TeGR_g10186 [Tetraparma gracilis]|uniref:Methyltransferase type 11 domain-containing protein n=1 Tax=Tetraparma gracilis TaxID=2962635 RepID=A0ABQ6M9J1_9STRA|nr:hypothetical protein TeGR_g10186 [Tetraparma gracilis]
MLVSLLLPLIPLLASSLPLPLPRRALLSASLLPLLPLLPSPSSAYPIAASEPDLRATFRLAQASRAPAILWLGCGDLSGAYKDLFKPGASVVALDLVAPSPPALAAAAEHLRARGVALSFVRGDAAALPFAPASFDCALCSMFLCQDFDPSVVVSGVRRVLREGGRFGFFEHVENIDEVIVPVFGERSIVRIQHAPKLSNIMAGVVAKV